MKKFVFKLEKILNFKEQEEKEAKAQLGLATSEVEKIEKKILDNKKLFKVSSTLSTKDDMIYYQTLFNSVRIENGALEKELIIKKERRKKAVEKYNEALMELKKFTKLKEKKFEEYKREYVKTDIKNVDDIISSNFKALKEKQLWQDTEA